MKFYLVYKTHGLYDPVVDDTEIYVPIGPNDIDQAANFQNTTVQSDTKASTDKTKTTHQSFDVANTSIILNLSCKHEFPELNIEELPPHIKYKLPISDQYDPEGKEGKSILKKMYDRNILTVDINKIIGKIKKETNEIQSINTMQNSERVGENWATGNNLPDKIGYDLDKIEVAASDIVNDSLKQAISVANKLKKEIFAAHHSAKQINFNNLKPNIKTREESLYDEKNIFKEEMKKNAEKLKSENRNDERLKIATNDYTFLSDETINHREISVAREIEKFESLSIEMESKLNEKERKLLTQQDIQEAIDAGTVRERTKFLKEGTDKVILENKIRDRSANIHETKRNNITLARQHAFNLGKQILLRLRSNVQPSYYCCLIIKRFLMQITRVMVSLSKFIFRDQKYNYIKHEKNSPQIKEHNIDNTTADHNTHIRNRKNIEPYGAMSNVLKKGKLSGAKIAQIEGLKPAELTKKMNVVISEFQRRSGIEESHERDDDKDSNMFQSSFRSRSNSNTKQEDHFKECSPLIQETDQINNKFLTEVYENKSQSLEIKETKYEKRFSESKSSKHVDTKLYSCKEKETDSKNLTYIAIVEAHVYTNKDAIFEEQMKRMTESMYENQSTESNTIYYKCEVSVFYKDYRESSQPTIVIESIEEIPSEEAIHEEEKHISFEKSTSGVEDVAKKLAVQKITEIIEPFLLNIKDVKSINKKQAHATIEMPLKTAEETSNMMMEKEENIIKTSKRLTEQPLITIEEPVKTVVETSEISIDEDKHALLEVIKTYEEKSRSTIEMNAKAIAETSETIIDEDKISYIENTLPVLQKPCISVETATKTVAETKEVTTDEANLIILGVPKTLSIVPRTKVDRTLLSVAESMTTTVEESSNDSLNISQMCGISARIEIEEHRYAPEILEINTEESTDVELKLSEMKSNQGKFQYELPVFCLPETITTAIEEPICEGILIPKLSEKVAKINISANIAPAINEVFTNEKELDSFYVNSVTITEPNALQEKYILTVAEVSVIVPIESSEPSEKYLELTEITKTQLQCSIQDIILTVAETLVVLSEGPKDKDLIITKFELAQASLDFLKCKYLSVLDVYFQEPNLEELEIFKLGIEQPHVSIQLPQLLVCEKIIVIPNGPKTGDLEATKIQNQKASINIDEIKPLMISIITSEGPKEEDLERPTVAIKQPQMLIEGSVLIVAENASVFLHETEDVLRITKLEALYPNVTFEELKLPKTMIHFSEEPKYENLDISQIKKEQSQIVVANTNLTLAESITSLIHEREEEFTVNKLLYQQPQVNFEELQAAETVLCFSEEPCFQDLEITKTKKEEPKLAVEITAHVVAENLTSFTHEQEDILKVHKILKQQLKVDFEDMKVPETLLCLPEESASDNLRVPRIQTIESQISVVDTSFSVAENIFISPHDKEDELKLPQIVRQCPTVNFEELKVAETAVLYPEEPKYENIKINEVRGITSKSGLVDSNFLVAEIVTTLPLDTKEEIFEETKITNQHAHMEIEELKSIESTITFAEEVKPKEFISPDLVAQQPQGLIEKSKKSIAQITFVNTNEIENDFSVSSKAEAKKANVTIETIKPISQSATLPIEEVEQDINRNSKLNMNQANVVIIESTAATISETISVTMAQEEAFKFQDKSKQVKITLEEPMKAEAKIQEINVKEACKIEDISDDSRDFTEVDITKYKVELAQGSSSSSTSSIPSSPSSLIEEYVFGVKGHEYKVQSPQETSFDIKSIFTKATPNIQSLDTSYTLIKEATTVSDQHIEILEEVTETVDMKKNQFWISDIKTMESVESEASLHLKKSNLEIDAAAAYLGQNSALNVRSRSQSYDQSAEFEINMQSSRELEFIKTETNIQETKYDFKSGSSYQSVQEVQCADANVSIKSKAAKTSATAQNVDISYGLVIENDTIGYDQFADFEMESSYETKGIKTATKLEKKGTSKEKSLDKLRNENVLEVSNSNYKIIQANIESDISKSSQLAITDDKKSKVLSLKKYSAKDVEIDVSSVSDSRYLGIKSSNASSVSNAQCFENETNIELNTESFNKSSENIVMDVINNTESSFSSSSILEAKYSEKEGSIKLSKSLKSAEVDAVPNLALTNIESDAEVKGYKYIYDLNVPSTPLSDEYMFRLETDLPDEVTFVSRDCSFSPESVHEDSLIVVNGMIPHIETRIERIIYSPPLLTPPTSPDGRVEPIFSRLGLKGGSEAQEFTKEEILKIGRESALLASAIDKTIRSIEEYKESVGISMKRDCNTEKREIDKARREYESLVCDDGQGTIELCEEGEDRDITKRASNISMTDKETESSKTEQPMRDNAKTEARKKMTFLSRFS